MSVALDISKVLVRGIEYRPIGLANGIKKMVTDVHTGNGAAAEIIDNIASGMTGTALVGLGALLASSCLLTSGEGGDDDRDKFDKLNGHQEYALELKNGVSVTLDWLAPESMPLFVGAKAFRAWVRKENPFDLTQFWMSCPR